MGPAASVPEDKSWIVSIHVGSADAKPIGSGIVVDQARVLTCRHVADRCKDPTELRLVFPFGEDEFGPGRAMREVRAAAHQLADVAILQLVEPIPGGVRPARLSRRRTRWWVTAGGRTGSGMRSAMTRPVRSAGSVVVAGSVLTGTPVTR
jgi:Trypsin-like peptidase domain